MKNIILKLIFLSFITTNSICCQIKNDSIRIINNNCATRLARDYMLKMGVIDNDTLKTKPLSSSELLKGSEFEKETNGVFIISTLSSHRRKLIVLKKDSQIKLLTFNDIGKSLIEIISFLRDIKTNNQELLNYLDSIQDYIHYSKNTIKSNTKIDNSDWIKCKE